MDHFALMGHFGQLNGIIGSTSAWSNRSQEMKSATCALWHMQELRSYGALKLHKIIQSRLLLYPIHTSSGWINVLVSLKNFGGFSGLSFKCEALNLEQRLWGTSITQVAFHCDLKYDISWRFNDASKSIVVFGNHTFWYTYVADLCTHFFSVFLYQQLVFFVSPTVHNVGH